MRRTDLDLAICSSCPCQEASMIVQLDPNLLKKNKKGRPSWSKISLDDLLSLLFCFFSSSESIRCSSTAPDLCVTSVTRPNIHNYQFNSRGKQKKNKNQTSLLAPVHRHRPRSKICFPSHLLHPAHMFLRGPRVHTVQAWHRFHLDTLGYLRRRWCRIVSVISEFVTSLLSETCFLVVTVNSFGFRFFLSVEENLWFLWMILTLSHARFL